MPRVWMDAINSPLSHKVTVGAIVHKYPRNGSAPEKTRAKISDSLIERIFNKKLYLLPELEVK